MLQPCAVFLTLRLEGQGGCGWQSAHCCLPVAEGSSARAPCISDTLPHSSGGGVGGGAELGGGAPLSCAVEVRLLWTAETSCDLRAGFQCRVVAMASPRSESLAVGQPQLLRSRKQRPARCPGSRPSPRAHPWPLQPHSPVSVARAGRSPRALWTLSETVDTAACFPLPHARSLSCSRTWLSTHKAGGRPIGPLPPSSLPFSAGWGGTGRGSMEEGVEEGRGHQVSVPAHGEPQCGQGALESVQCVCTHACA